MNVRLTISQKDKPGTTQESRVESFDADVILLGRDAHCNVVLPLKAVSRAHARIVRDGGVFYIEDVGSSFGTQVNNEPLPQGEKRRLYNGDVIAIAQFDVRFETVVPMPTGTFAWRPSASKASSPLAIIVSEKPYLRIMNGPNEGTRIELEEGHEYVVGRAQDAQILLNTDLVSRRHAKLRRDLAGTHVEDLESRNGIRLNRKSIVSATLSDGDELEIGGVKMLYIDLSEMKDNPLPFDKPETKSPAQQQARPPPPPPPPPPEKKEVPKPPPEPPPPPPEEPPVAENADDFELPPEMSEKKPPPPLLKRKQAYVLLGISGGAALIALIFLILLLVGA